MGVDSKRGKGSRCEGKGEWNRSTTLTPSFFAGLFIEYGDMADKGVEGYREVRPGGDVAEALGGMRTNHACIRSNS